MKSLVWLAVSLSNSVQGVIVLHSIFLSVLCLNDLTPYHIDGVRSLHLVVRNHHVRDTELMELDDDECTIEVPPDGDCTDELDARAHLTKALQAKRDLKELEQSIRTNDFVVALKEGREEDWKNHWYNDYMDYYYM